MLISGWIMEGIIGAGMWIVIGIYHVAAFAFELFLILASGRLLDSSDYGTIITNFYVVLGIIMLFALAFALLKGMVNPEDQKQGTSVVKKTIINLITSMVIMSVLPTVFTFAFDFQDSFIMEQNTIGKFFGYGTQGSSSDNPSSESNLEKVKQGAYQIVNGVWTAFFNVNSEYCNSLVEEDDPDLDTSNINKAKIDYCQEEITSKDEAYIETEIDGQIVTVERENSFTTASQYAETYGKLGIYTSFVTNVDDSEIDFNFLLAMIAGLMLIFVAVSFCFDMAVRLVKLVFYQLIAPIPIFFRIIPNSKLNEVFGSWCKITLTVYMEVYIRIFVFYFCIFLCNAMMQSSFLGEDIYQYGWFLAFLAKAFVLMGIITFMRQVPKLISEITGLDSGNMKLGIREKLAAGGFFTAGAIVGGGLTAATRNATNAFQNNFEKGKDGKWHKKEGVTNRKVLGSVFTGGASTLAGLVSGGARSGKAGMGAKNFGDMGKSASSGARAAVDARDKRATYKANYGKFDGTFTGWVKGQGRVLKKHGKDALQGVSEWAGVGVVTSTEADWFSSGANAFDAAHSQMESAYKGKPEHNKIKERMTELNGEYSKVSQQINALENTVGPLTQEQTQHLTELRNRLTILKGEIAAQDAFKSQHEAKEMGKKLSLQMEAINGLVNAKMKYFDMSSAIFSGEQGEQLYSLLKDAQGRTDSEAVKNLVSKIQQNQTISMSDLKDAEGNIIINMNSLEKFVDQVGIKAKDMAAEKRVEVAHAKALKDEKKSDGK